MQISIVSFYESKAKKVFHSLSELSQKHDYKLLLINDINSFVKPDFELIIVICEKNSKKSFEIYNSLVLEALKCHWIFVSDNYSVEDRTAMKHAGNISFVYYDSPLSILAGAIEISLGKGQYFDPGFNGKKIHNLAEELLTKYKISQKEFNVIQGLRSGRSAKEIGVWLAISSSTVETHRKNIYKKLGIHKILQLAQVINEMEE